MLSKIKTDAEVEIQQNLIPWFFQNVKIICELWFADQLFNIELERLLNLNDVLPNLILIIYYYLYNIYNNGYNNVIILLIL